MDTREAIARRIRELCRSAWDHAERACDDLCGSAGDDQKHSERREQKSRRRYDQKALRRL